jgi:hypothetical protein
MLVSPKANVNKKVVAGFLLAKIHKLLGVLIKHLLMYVEPLILLLLPNLSLMITFRLCMDISCKILICKDQELSLLPLIEMLIKEDLIIIIGTEMELLV